MRHGRPILLLAAAIAALAGAAAPSAGAAPAAVAGELLVRFEPGTSRSRRAEIRQEAGTAIEESLPLSGLQLVKVAGGRTADAEQRLEQSDGVLYAEPNVLRNATLTPNDTYFGRLWGLHNTGQTVSWRTGTADADIDAPEAWEATAGSDGVTVAVVDSGIDVSHPDLAPNAWLNTGESGSGRETNGVDDDADGFADDVAGWDFVDGDATPQDDNGHGTHVAGTIAARGNDGVGVAGVSWYSRLMNLRVLDATGSGSLADVIAAYGYAARKGAAVVNASLGGPGFSQAEYDTIRTAPGVLFVVAAGNSGLDVETVPEYPCAYDLPNVVCVAATGQHDELATFSNSGAASVDLGAPGTTILSDQPGGGYAYYSGTSMATPHVAGAAALILSRYPAAGVAGTRSALLAGVDPLPSLAGKTVTGGRLNIASSLGIAPAAPPPPPAAPSPAPTPGGALAPPDVPRVALSVSRVQRLGRVLRRGVRVRAACSRRCTVSSRVVLRRVPRATAGGHLSTTVHSGRTRTFSIALTKRARSALRSAGRARITVVARAVSGASVGRLVRRSVIVRRLTRD